MEQRRIVLFIALSMAILIGWSNVIMPRLFPPPPKADKVAEAADEAAQQDAEQGEVPADAMTPANIAAAGAVAVAEPPAAAPAGAPPAAAPVTVVPQHPLETVELGSLDPASPFFLSVKLTSEGAAVTNIELNDKRYPEFGRRGTPLKILGADPLATVKTFGLRSSDVDKQLKPEFLDTVNWEIVPDSKTDHAVEFRIVSPDGTLEFTKRYELAELTAEQLKTPGIRDTLADGYDLTLTVTVKNLSQVEKTVTYVLQGPVGIPLEDPTNSTKWRDVRMAFLEDDGAADPRHMRTREVVAERDKDTPEIWRRPLKYIGVDNKYFAALIQPLGDQLKARTVESAQPVVITEHRTHKDYSDVSVELKSPALKLPPGGSISNGFEMFAGPKKKELLAAMSATSIVFDNEGSGFFLFLWNLFQVETIAEFMLWLLKSLHSLGVGYGIAIIMLTAVVRGAMFPLSKKQVANMEKMKKLQPELQALQKKYAQQPEQFVQAQRELFRKHQYHPAQGCLPVFVQMPIFVGLYWALNTSLDLRMAKFLWIDSLASPDALFNLPFTVPFFEWTQFNLLPILTIVLFVAQQKLTMPPPTTEEQAMQYKVMNFMMIFMGAMFYRVPAGLCLYFIASSLWGIIERWLLSRHKETLAATADGAELIIPASDSNRTTKNDDKPKPKSGLALLWGNLQDAADREKGSGGGTVRNSGNDTSRKPKKR